MKKIKLLLLTMLLVTTVGVFCGCSDSTNAEETEYQEELMQQASDEVGMPDITEFFEKKLAKEIFEKRDNSDLICYAYGVNLDGQYIYLGACYGYGLPYSTQYTNPERIAYSNGNAWDLPQADPNGLYGADGLSATWLMMVDENSGESYIMYYEPTITVTETKLPKRLIAEWSLPNNY